MSVTNQQFDILKKPENSWALWDTHFDNKNCICNSPYRIEPDLLRPNLHILNNSVIFLGLNRSKSLIADYQSFHFPKSNDKILKEYIQECGLSKLIGGFMTDLLDVKEESSKKVEKWFKSENKKTDGAVSKQTLKILYEKFLLLDPPKNKIDIICFGNICFDILRLSLELQSKQIMKLPNNIKKIVYSYQNIEINIFRVWHYANYGNHQNKVVELRNQLTYLNEIL